MPPGHVYIEMDSQITKPHLSGVCEILARSRRKRTPTHSKHQCLPYLRTNHTFTILLSSQCDRISLGDSHSGRAGALIALHSENLVVMAAKVETSFGPGVKMGRDIDGAAIALITTNRPILLEGLGSVNRRSVGAGNSYCTFLECNWKS